MAYVFYDLPADSSELETLKGYHVARVAKRARGGPLRREDPFAPAPELVLNYPRRPWFAPVVQAMRAPGMARKVHSRAWSQRGFMSARQATSYLCVPMLCFVLVWLIGHIWP